MPGSSPPTPSRVARRLLPLLAGLGLAAIVALTVFGLRPVVAWTHHGCVPDGTGATVAPGPDGIPVVTSLRTDSPAARAGLHVGDPVAAQPVRVQPVRFRQGAAL